MKTLLSLLALCFSVIAYAQPIPLPEHPRPDFERPNWINLNGTWDFEFDSLNIGKDKNWQSGTPVFSHKITVPFPWGSPLSGVKDEADFAWYKRKITVPKSWANQRVFLDHWCIRLGNIVWLDGVLLGNTRVVIRPFLLNLTDHVKYGAPQNLVIRVDDKRSDFALYGKQGYGNARGIWQTIYLEGEEIIM